MYKNDYASMNQSIGNAIGSAQMQKALPPAGVTQTPEVQMRVGEMEQNLLELHGTIGVVLSRLESVLQYPVPEGVGEGKASSSQSPLGEKLLGLNGQVLHATARLQDLLRRLEV